MRFRKTIVALALSSAAATAWAFGGPGSGAGMSGTGGEERGEGRSGQHYRGHGHGHGYGHAHGHRHNHAHGDGHRQGPGDGYRHGGPRGGWSAMDPERMDARIERMAERLVKSVDGTEEQQEKVSALAKEAAKDLRALREQRRELRKQGLALLKAPEIDRAAIEALRSQQMAVADSASKRLSVALADAAEVLTPEQRAKLAERMSRRGQRG